MKISKNYELITTEVSNLMALQKPVLAKGTINFKEGSDKKPYFLKRSEREKLEK